MKRILTILFVIGLTITGCSSTSVEVSKQCADAMEAFGLTEGDQEVIALTETTRACSSVDEYLAAVKANPASWWFDSVKDVNEEHVIILACHEKNSDEPTCVDAKAKGLVK